MEWGNDGQRAKILLYSTVGHCAFQWIQSPNCEGISPCESWKNVLDWWLLQSQHQELETSLEQCFHTAVHTAGSGINSHHCKQLFFVVRLDKKISESTMSVLATHWMKHCYYFLSYNQIRSPLPRITGAFVNTTMWTGTGSLGVGLKEQASALKRYLPENRGCYLFCFSLTSFVSAWTYLEPHIYRSIV